MHMSKELNRSICLRNVYSIDYNATPTLESSGRYITTLHHILKQLKNENDKIEYQYLINSLLLPVEHQKNN